MKCFLSLRERHRALRGKGTHDEQIRELRQAGQYGATDPTPDTAARRMIRLRIMQQIQCIDAESRDQPLFAQCGIRVWKAAVTKIHASRISDSAQSTFPDPALWKS
jgi:hypothetical protein